MKFTLFLAAVAGVTQAVDLTLLQKHEDRFVKHVKQYNVQIDDDATFRERLSIFAKNVEFINAENAGNNTYTLGQNQFTHLTFEEFSGKFLNLVPPNMEGYETNDFAGAKAADSVDWSTSDAVTPVKDQGYCGSCWTFSTTGAMEAAYFMKNGKQESFSEQQFVDCDHMQGSVNNGCSGGWPSEALDYASKFGVCAERDYSYIGQDNQCQMNVNNCQVVDGTMGLTYTNVANSEDALAKAVTKQPVSVCVDADSRWQSYSGGILTGLTETQLDHAVLAVGFASEDGQDFWKIKNSWATSWGEDGYIRIERNTNQQDGPAGITSRAVYATLA